MTQVGDLSHPEQSMERRMVTYIGITVFIALIASLIFVGLLAYSKEKDPLTVTTPPMPNIATTPSTATQSAAAAPTVSSPESIDPLFLTLQEKVDQLTNEFTDLDAPDVSLE